MKVLHVVVQGGDSLISYFKLVGHEGDNSVKVIPNLTNDVEYDESKTYGWQILIVDTVPRKRIVFTLKTLLNSRICWLFVHLVFNNTVYQESVLSRYLPLTEISSTRNEYEGILVLRITKYFKESVDIMGNELADRYISERKHLEIALSWLSTLGGAFSALGDSVVECALTAGKISLQQLALAWRLRDPYVVIRCKLYCALSLIQQKRFKVAKGIIKSQFIAAKLVPVVDKKLLAMCHGIWAKLRHERSVHV